MGVSSDSSGNIWAAANILGSALYAANAGAVAGAYGNGGLNNPQKTFVDGANIVWVSNTGANTVSALNPSTGNWLASNGFATSAQADTGAVAIAVDPSGNVWVANSDKSVTELLGLATPTASPLYAGSTTTTSTTKGNLGTKP
jgi:streptogramin lyase